LAGKEDPDQFRARKEREQYQRQRENAFHEAKQAAAKLDDEQPLLKTAPLNQGKLIQQARMAKGLTQKKVAQHLSVKATLVQKWEQNQAVPTGKHKYGLNSLLGIKLPKAVKRG